MKTRRENNLIRLILTVLWVLPFVLQAETWEVVKKREMSKRFPVNENCLLSVDNTFGNIEISYWDKQEVSIRVEVESAASRDQLAQQNLDRVKVDLHREGDRIVAVTSLVKSNQDGQKNERITINYYISVPFAMDMNLSQRFGNITLPDQNSGKNSLTVKFGNLNAGSFTKELQLEAKYSNVSLGNLDKATLSFGFCGDVDLRDAKSLTIDSKYSTLRMENVDELKMEQKYGNLRAGELKRAFFDIKYSNSTIEKLSDELIVENLDYSTLEIQDLKADFSRVQAESRYGTLDIRISPKASFKIIAEHIGNNLNVQELKETKHTVENKTDHLVEINGGGTRVIKFEGNRYANLKIRAK